MPRLISSASTQTHILGLGLAPPNIYPIYDLLERVNSLVLLNNSHSISMTPSNGIQREVSVRVQY